MTVSAPAYSATVAGTSIDVSDGSVSLDAATAPHVKGEISVSGAGAALLGALDPRQSPPPRVILTCGGRVFDLHVRDRDTDRRGSAVSVVLASDEALVQDYAPLGDDDAPFSLAASLRAVVNYVLGKAIPGAVLEVTPALDADVTPYWAVTNLLTNSSFEGGSVGWVSGANADGAAPYASRARTGSRGLIWRSVAAGLSFVDSVPVRVAPGRSYVLSVYINPLQTNPASLQIRFRDDANATIQFRYSTPVSAPAGTWTRLVLVVTAPPAATAATVHVAYHAAGANLYPVIDDAMFHEGTRAVPFFYPGVTSGGGYTYAWTEAAHISASTRTPDVERDPESLIWKAGQGGLDFLMPLVQARGLRLVCDERRRWTLRNESHTAAGSASLREGVNMIEAHEKISRDAGIWFDARVTRYRWMDSDGISQERVDSYALSAAYTMQQTVEIDAAYPGPGRSEYAVRRAQGIGREVSATLMADWSVTAEQPVSVLLSDTPPQSGVVSAVRFDLGRNEMTVEARTRDIGARSIDALTGTINALTGTIDNLGA